MKVALVGYDVEGQASYRYYARDPANTITIFDEAVTPPGAAPTGVRVVAGPSALETLRQEAFDVVVRTPSLAPAKLTGVAHVTSATQEFLRLCPAPVIGVTGTKGKGTTASFIHSILTAAGKKSWLVGNIGTPALDVLPAVSDADIVVYELSSFQLWDVTQSPHIAVLLMVEPDHLDVHPDFADYVNAKANITRYQTAADTLVFNNLNDTATQVAIQSRATKVPYPDANYARVEGDHFWYGEHKLCSISSLKLPGIHNQQNACAAIAAVWPYVKSAEAVRSGLAAFDGLPHRLKLVRTVNDVRYYDDSIATTPGSAIAAIRAFEAPKIVILGGSDKGADFGPLYAAVRSGGVKRVITIGDLGGHLAEALQGQGYTAVTALGRAAMPDIVAAARSIAKPGDIVIMSPACASFDMFRNYKDRGEQFVAAVEAL